MNVEDDQPTTGARVASKDYARDDRLRGVFPASLTMFRRNGDIDEKGTARHARYLLKEGAHGIIAGGTSGEFIAMTCEERNRVCELIVDEVGGAAPVFAGTGHYSTRLTIEMTHGAEMAGANGVIIILPYYQKPPKNSILNHYRNIRRETNLPIMLYNNPAYAGCVELSAPEIAALYAEGTIRAIKSTFASVVPVHDLLSLCDENFRIFYGSFQSPMEALFAGAHGWISGFPNLLPSLCVELYEACYAKDVDGARAVWRMLLPFKQFYTLTGAGEVNDIAIYRAGLELLGEHGGFSRLPFEPLPEEMNERLRILLRDAGLIE